MEIDQKVDAVHQMVKVVGESWSWPRRGRGEGDRGPGPGDRGPGGRGDGERGPGDRGPEGAADLMLGQMVLVVRAVAWGIRSFEFDADGDGKLSKSELENAAKALSKLDKNGDGELTPEELMPPRPGDRGPDGPGAEARGPGNRGPGAEGRRREGQGPGRSWSTWSRRTRPWGAGSAKVQMANGHRVDLRLIRIRT